MRLYSAFRIAFLLSLEKVSALYFASRGHTDALLLLVIYDSIGIKGKGCIFSVQSLHLTQTTSSEQRKHHNIHIFQI